LPLKVFSCQKSPLQGFRIELINGFFRIGNKKNFFKGKSDEASHW
jgi:hypothetical protein